VLIIGIFSGTKNLRVADMTIVPIQIATHTCETAYAIGEKVTISTSRLTLLDQCLINSAGLCYCRIYLFLIGLEGILLRYEPENENEYT